MDASPQTRSILSPDSIQVLSAVVIIVVPPEINCIRSPEWITFTLPIISLELTPTIDVLDNPMFSIKLVSADMDIPPVAIVDKAAFKAFF